MEVSVVVRIQELLKDIIVRNRYLLSMTQKKGHVRKNRITLCIGQRKLSRINKQHIQSKCINKQHIHIQSYLLYR